MALIHIASEKESFDDALGNQGYTSGGGITQ
jgi:hypothetical protein